MGPHVLGGSRRRGVGRRVGCGCGSGVAPDGWSRLGCAGRMEGAEERRGAREANMDKAAVAAAQGLTLVHFSAQRKHFMWDRGCIRDYSGGV